MMWNKDSTEWESLVKWSKRIKVGLIDITYPLVLEGIDRDEEAPLNELSNGHTYECDWNRDNVIKHSMSHGNDIIRDYCYKKKKWIRYNGTIEVNLIEPYMRFNIHGGKKRKRLKVHSMIDEICQIHNIKDLEQVSLHNHMGWISWKKPTHPFFKW